MLRWLLIFVMLASKISAQDYYDRMRILPATKMDVSVLRLQTRLLQSNILLRDAEAVADMGFSSIWADGGMLENGQIVVEFSLGILESNIPSCEESLSRALRLYGLYEETDFTRFFRFPLMTADEYQELHEEGYLGDRIQFLAYRSFNRRIVDDCQSGL